MSPTTRRMSERYRAVISAAVNNLNVGSTRLAIEDI
jgi:hypothetical protein